MPSPTTATVRPFSDAVPNASAHETSIATCTPSAVHGDGSPEPPLRRERPLTCEVCPAMTVMSRAAVPTSSAVT